eukprot:SM000116S24200  [mRNA]  locus=s116:53167:56005:+ [translate_table: standard]
MRRSAASSWVAGIGGAAEPFLSADEEARLAQDVQEWLRLEATKQTMEKELGRRPSDQEWAEACGLTLVQLLAKMGMGRRARRRMVSANLRLVNKLAERYGGMGVAHADLCQEGATGLLHSTTKFEPERMARFSSYSFLWIARSMRDAIQRHGRPFRLPMSVWDVVNTVKKLGRNFEELHGRPPSFEELGKLTKFRPHRVQTAQRAMKSVWSIESLSIYLSRSSQSDDEVQLSSQLRDANPWQALGTRWMVEELWAAMHQLDPREQQLLELRFGLSGGPQHTQVQVSAIASRLKNIPVVWVHSPEYQLF